MNTCDLCNSKTIEGQLGESKYICSNTSCKRSNPHWAIERINTIISPFNKEMEKYSTFSKGTIDFYEARWVGKGSAEITLRNGTEFICHLKSGKLHPLESPYFEDLGLEITKDTIKEIKHNMLKLIELRDKKLTALKRR